MAQTVPYSTIIMVRKFSFSFVEPKWKRNIEYYLNVEVQLSGNSSRYIMYMYRRQAINQFSQWRVGLGNSYCNFLAICPYFFQIKTFSVVDKIFLKSLITVLIFFLCYYLFDKQSLHWKVPCGMK